MRCPSCGAEVGQNNIFCLNCGAKVEIPVSPSAVLPPLGNNQPSPLMRPANPGSAGPVPPMTPPSPVNRQYQQQPAYQQPMPGFAPATPLPTQKVHDTSGIVSMGNWLATMLILFFAPVVLTIIASLFSAMLGPMHIVTTILLIIAGIAPLVLMFIFAFSGNVNPSKRNFFRASLILTAVVLVLCVVLYFVFKSMFTTLLGGLGLGIQGIGLSPDDMSTLFENLI